MTKKNHQKIKQLLLKNPSLICKLAYDDIGYFMFFCLSHLFEYPFGIFQISMMWDTVNNIKNIVCPTFPDSYTEEIFMYSYVLWSILGKNKYTNCVIVCGTREKAKEVYLKFENEFLNNPELRKFNHKVTKECCDGWNIFIPGFNARISILSFPMFPSRIRHKRRSPDIVICCDLEDSFADEKDISYWMEEQLYDSIYFYQKTIVFGTMNKSDNLFEDIRLRGDTFNDRRKKFNVTFTPYPLFGDNKECFWEEKYSPKEIKEMLKNWNDKKWQVKHLLHTYKTFKVPKEYFNTDGTCKVEEYRKYLEKEKYKNKDDASLWNLVNQEVAEMRKAEEYSMFHGAIKYFGIGVVVTYKV
ncbi:MAG: hypothetical protein WCG28_03170, partial [bacterium]